jgi:hypothetical protein
MLYMVLTGQRPFAGNTAQELARTIVAAKSLPLAVYDAGDDDLQHLILRGFGSAPNRLQRVEDLAAELTVWIARNRHLAEGIDLVREATRVESDAGPPSVEASVMESHAIDDDPGAVELGSLASASGRPIPPLEEASALHNFDSVDPLANARRALRPGNALSLQSIEPTADLPFGGTYDEPEDEKTELNAAPLFSEDRQHSLGLLDALLARNAEPRAVTPHPPQAVVEDPPHVALENPPHVAFEDPPQAVVEDPPQVAAALVQAMTERAEAAWAPTVDPTTHPAQTSPAREAISTPPPSPHRGSGDKPDAASISGSDRQRQLEQEPSSAIEDAEPVQSRRERKSSWASIAIGSAALAIGVGAGAFAWFRTHPDTSMSPRPNNPAVSTPLSASSLTPLPSSTTAPFAPVSAATTSAPASASAPAPAIASAPPVASVTSSASAAALSPPDNVTTCVESFYAADTFVVKQDLAFVCDNADPRKGTAKMRASIVRGGRGTFTTGMDEWPRLGWYELLVWGVLRAACCPGSAVIEIPKAEPCEWLQPSVERAAQAILARQREQADQALAEFEKAAMCMQFQQTRPFKYTTPPRSGGQLPYGKFVTRAVNRP